MVVQNKVLVSVLDKKFKKMEKPLKKVVFNLLRAFPKLRGAAVEIYLVGNKFIKKNVLAFPAPKNFPRPDLAGRKFLGEIYLNPDYIRKEKLPPLLAGSRRRRGEIPAGLVHMLIHGFLHLLGYDHKKEGDRIKMVKKEKRLLKLLGY